MSSPIAGTEFGSQHDSGFQLYLIPPHVKFLQAIFPHFIRTVSQIILDSLPHFVVFWFLTLTLQFAHTLLCSPGSAPCPSTPRNLRALCASALSSSCLFSSLANLQTRPICGPFSSKSFRCHTSAKSARNSFNCHTSRNKGLISPLFATLTKKQGGPQ
jgi:hypothetical protein